ncbi:protein doublesex-like [Frankliniella occidentalis]|uniref:Protein doublesex-like n=1 Tax=Frankliniella occidentalis TaxID=133901 RepID=A0A9C6XUW6_FRAOC|nr:protein doublesex-like [Frankliniella occidentalis]
MDADATEDAAWEALLGAAGGGPGASVASGLGHHHHQHHHHNGHHGHHGLAHGLLGSTAPPSVVDSTKSAASTGVFGHLHRHLQPLAGLSFSTKGDHQGLPLFR